MKEKERGEGRGWDEEREGGRRMEEGERGMTRED